MLVLSFVLWSVGCLPATSAVLKVCCFVLVPCVKALQLVTAAESRCPAWCPCAWACRRAHRLVKVLSAGLAFAFVGVALLIGFKT